MSNSTSYGGWYIFWVFVVIFVIIFVVGLVGVKGGAGGVGGLKVYGNAGVLGGVGLDADAQGRIDDGLVREMYSHTNAELKEQFNGL